MEWIRISERHPPTDCDEFLAWDGVHIQLNLIWYYENDEGTEPVFLSQNGCSYEPTHWMPLPLPPVNS